MRKALILNSSLAVVLVLAASASPAFATCPGNLPQPLQHLLGGYFARCPDAKPVKAYAYALSTGVAPDTACPNAGACNSSAIDIACEDAAGQSGQFASCQAEAGIQGDGNVTVLFDWGGSGTFPGCPNSAQLEHVGRNFVQVTANDGSSVMASVNFSFDLLGYIVDFAEQNQGGVTVPLNCTHTEAGLRFTSYDGATFCGNVPVPVVHTDCDPGTWGVDGGGVFQPTCFPSNLPAVTRGNLYSRTASCGTTPDNTLASGWTLLPVTPDAAGSFCVAVPRPASTPSDPQCAFVAASAKFGGVETLAGIGSIQLAGQNAASPRATAVRLAARGADVVISFKTTSELDLAGFNILVDKSAKGRSKVNDAVIAGKGIGGAGASYEVRIPRANFKGGRTVYVESLLLSGGSILSDPATF